MNAMNEWYEQNIEPDIRPFVKLLRDHGFNTEDSCDHEMYVQCEYIPEGEIKRLHNLLWNFLHENHQPINFAINVSHKVIDGHVYSSLCIKVNRLSETGYELFVDESPEYTEYQILTEINPVDRTPEQIERLVTLARLLIHKDDE